MTKFAKAVWPTCAAVGYNLYMYNCSEEGLIKQIQMEKFHNKIQSPHIFFYTLLVMLGNYELTCIVTIKMVTM